MPRMMAAGVLMIAMFGRCSIVRKVLITPFFSRSVCHAMVLKRKFIHIGRMKMNTTKKEADHGADSRERQGEPEGLQMLRGTDGQDVCQGECPTAVRQSIVEYHEQRDHRKSCHPYHIRISQKSGCFSIH